MIKFIFGDVFRFRVGFVRGACWETASQKNKTNRETPRDETGKENQI